MKELNKTKRLVIASGVFVIVIITGLVFLNRPNFVYEKSPEQMLESLYDIDNEMIPDEAMDILAYGDSLTVFIDIRSTDEFYKGHLEGAINIPVSDILEETSIDMFDEMKADSLIVIIYGATQAEANASWMILEQLGYDNIKILLGGYNYLSDSEIDYYDMPEVPVYFVEEPIMDFAGFIEERSSIPIEELNQQTEQKEVVPIKRKKKVISEGGC